MSIFIQCIAAIFLTLSASATDRFWIWDLTVMPPAYRRPDFEKAKQVKGTHLWIEKDLGSYAPTATTIEEISSLLTEKTPPLSKNPTMGIIEIEKQYFGNPPVPPSGDPDIHFLIASIPPYVNKKGQKFGHDGFFNVFDQFTEEQAQAQSPSPQHSNEKNILYLNARQDMATPYMQGVIAHELVHLLLFINDETKALESWVGEMLGEAGMLLTGFYTDAPAVEKYLKKTEEVPLVADSYGIHYGALALFAEFLIKNYDPKLLSQINTVGGDGYTKIEQIYNKSWHLLFEEFISWLYLQNPKSNFGSHQSIPLRPTAQELTPTLLFAPNGVLYLTQTVELKNLSLSKIPSSCSDSKNVIRTKALKYENKIPNAETQVESNQAHALAMWIESRPPCLPSKADRFVVEVHEASRSQDQ